MTHKIPYGNWTMALADAIETCADGDTILCHSNAMAEMGKSAQKRMCPDKNIIFEIEKETDSCN